MATSNARVSQIVAQILRTPIPPSNARVSQIVTQTLRAVEAQYSTTPSAQSARTAVFKGVKNIPIAPLPYNVECVGTEPFVQSMVYPTLIRTGFQGAGTGKASGSKGTSPIVAGKATVLSPTAFYDFEASAGGGNEALQSNPVMFGQRLFGSDNDGNFFAMLKPESLNAIGTTIRVNPPPSTGYVNYVLPRGDMQVLAVSIKSKLGAQLIAGYSNGNSFLNIIEQLLNFILSPAPTFLEQILLDPLLQILFGPPSPQILACGFITDWISGNANGSLAYQIASCLATYPGANQLANFPTMTGYKVPFAEMGGDPDLYIGSAGQICCDFNEWNSYQYWSNDRAFGISGALIYDFNRDTFNVVSLDDAATNTLFQDFANAGGSPIATPKGWLFPLAKSGGYGLNPATVPIMVTPNFDAWYLLNFIPTESTGTGMLVDNEVLQMSADSGGIYVGTPNNNYQYSGASGVAPNGALPPTPAITPGTPAAPIPSGCVNVDCSSTGLPYPEMGAIL